MRKNDAWDLGALHDGRKKISNKWVFKGKTNESSRIENFKARLVAEGYLQVEGVDFGEILSHVENLTSIRILMSLDPTFDLDIQKMDMKITFLHGDLKE